MARPGHRKTASLRTLAAFAAEQRNKPLTARDSSTTRYGQDYSLASGPPTGYYPPTRHLRLAPSPEVPIAFLDTDFVVLKANATFQRLFSWLQEIRGMRLSDIAKPTEGDSFQNARNQLREEREIREPAYLPPILQPRLDPVSSIGITDHDVEEVTRGFTDHLFAWTFRLGGGIDQTLPVRMRLAKTSVYFVTLFLPPLPPQISEQVIAPQPPPVMFPTRIIAPSTTSFQSSPRMPIQYLKPTRYPDDIHLASDLHTTTQCIISPSPASNNHHSRCFHLLLQFRKPQTNVPEQLAQAQAAS
ncbi:hypothetical protein E4T39_07040 [Aureobasidium subglaciale]|nr:hypothetical protein E4T39_07040 [Aureobasidium subglaciale]